MLKTALVEGMAVRARRPSRSVLGPSAVQAGEAGVVTGIGPVWDVSTETHVGVALPDGRYVVHPVEFANNLWEPT